MDAPQCLQIISFTFLGHFLNILTHDGGGFNPSFCEYSMNKRLHALAFFCQI